MSTNSNKLAGKVAVVTGASKGIGAAIAKNLAAEGAAVVVNYASSKTGADKVVAEITSAGGKAVAFQGDVAKRADIERLFAETKKTFGRLDILVNNAGIYEFSPLESITEEQFHKHFDLNVLGLILASQAAAKLFDSAGGSIINTSSIASTLAIPNSAVYSGSKGAVDAITRSLAAAAWWRQRGRTQPASRRARCASKSKRRRRSAALASLGTSRARWFSWPPAIRPGSRAKPSLSPEATAD